MIEFSEKLLNDFSSLQYLKDVKRGFHNRNRLVTATSKTIPGWFEGVDVSNESFGLNGACQRTNVPSPFTGFVKIVEERLGKLLVSPIPTRDEVISSDGKTLEDYKQFINVPTHISMTMLFAAALISAEELGIIRMSNGRIKKFKMTPIEESVETFNQGTSSGFPDYTKKRVVATKENAVARANELLRNPTTSIFKIPVTIFHRYQFKTYATMTDVVCKIRIIWGYALSVLTLSGYFFREINNSFIVTSQSKVIPASPAGRTTVQLSDLIRSFKIKGILASVDIEKFDSNVPGYMFALFFTICGLALDFTEEYEVKAYNNLMLYEIFTPFCWFSTKLKFTQRGLKSGTLITSLFGTWLSRTLQNYAALQATRGKESMGENGTAQGDDNLINTYFLALAIFVNVLKKFGFGCNLGKCDIQKEIGGTITWLGYTWDTLNRPTQSLNWYVAHFCYPSTYAREGTYPFPNDVYQTYRCLSTCLTLYNGLKMFEYLIGWNDRVYIDLLDREARGEPARIPYISTAGQPSELTIPLTLIRNYNWVRLNKLVKINAALIQ
jgi:hypothetical protein